MQNWRRIANDPGALDGIVNGESSTPVAGGCLQTRAFRKRHAQAAHFACSHPGCYPLSRRRRPKDCINEREEDAGVGGDGNLPTAIERARSDQVSLLSFYRNLQECNGGGGDDVIGSLLWACAQP